MINKTINIVNNKNIEIVTEIKYLGWLFDPKLKLPAYLRYLQGKMSNYNKNVFKFKNVS